MISDNHIYRSGRGIWLDWMTQGTHVTRNLVHDIAPREDLFVEVNHGPFLVDHNIFLSKISLLDVSEGGAYAHNLFAGKIIAHPELRRETPWQEEHGTKIAGLLRTEGGDNRFFNNLFVAPAGLDAYDNSTRPNQIAGNVFLKEYKLQLEEKNGAWHLETGRIEPGQTKRNLVTSDLLGKAAVSGQAYLKPDGSPHRLDTDYNGQPIDSGNPFPGPFTAPKEGTRSIKVWPE